MYPLPSIRPLRRVMQRLAEGVSMSNPAIALERMEAAGYIKARDRRDNCGGCRMSYATPGAVSSLWCIRHHGWVSSGGLCGMYARQSDLNAPRLADQSAQMRA